MINEFSSQCLKIGLLLGSGLVGIAAVDVGDEVLPDWMQGLERMGSFFLVALFVLGCFWAAKAMVPKFLEFLEKSKDGFLAELKETRITHAEEMKNERLSREAQTNAFREMMHAHRKETIEAIKEQTNYVARLVDQLEDRPCQMKQPRREQ